MGASLAKLVAFKLIDKSLSAIMNSAPVQAAIDNYAEELLEEANSKADVDYGLHPARRGKTRCHAIIYTPDLYATYSNAKHRTLASVYAEHKN